MYCEKQLDYEQSFAFKMKNEHLLKRSKILSNGMETMEGTTQGQYEAFVQGVINDSDYKLIKAHVEEQRNAGKNELLEIQAKFYYYQKIFHPTAYG